MNRRRLLVGIAVAAVGVIVARGNQFLLGQDSPHLLIAYAVGVLIALGGLVVVGSSLAKTYQKVVQCPECLTVNPADAEACRKCSLPLRPADRSDDNLD